METEHLFFEETSEKEEMCYPCTLILLTTDNRYYSMVQNNTDHCFSNNGS